MELPMNGGIPILDDEMQRTEETKKNMDFRHAWFEMLNGKKVKLPHWSGYWEWRDNTIMIHTREGEVFDIRKTDNVAYTFSNIAATNWEIVP